jgi:hypothetical protein
MPRIGNRKSSRKPLTEQKPRLSMDCRIKSGNDELKR